MSLTKPRNTYKPFEFPWAYDYWKQQQQSHWLPDEVPMFGPPEIQMMLSAFSNIECFDTETELLTGEGWVKVPDINSEHQIAQFNLETDEISFVKPLKVVSYPYKGVMHHYNSLGTDIMVTPNHDLIGRHPVSKVRDKKQSLERKWGRNYTYPCSGVSSVSHSHTSSLSALERLLIAIQADGCIRAACPKSNPNWRTVDFTLHKNHKAVRLRKYLRELGIAFSEKSNSSSDRKVFTFTVPEGINLHRVKSLGFIDLTEVSKELAVEIMEEILFWDGTTVNQPIYYNTNEEAVDKFQAIVTLTGESHRRLLSPD